MKTLAEIAAELGVTRAEARRIVAERIREVVMAEPSTSGRVRSVWTAADALEGIRSYVESTGRLPRHVDYDPNGDPPLPSRKTLARLFGSVSGALDAAGVVEIERQGVLFDSGAVA